MSEKLGVIKGLTFICEVPKELGEVTKLECKGGKIIAKTKSGIEMIVPTRSVAP
jgi:hypothetical protein